MSTIKLEQANAIIAGAFEHGREHGLKPLGVAVLDAGGHLIAFQRQDGASIMRAQIAVGKASGALGLGLSSRTIAAMAEERPVFVTALGSMTPQGVVPAAGGIIAVDASGERIGAVGVTGDTSDNDEACAFAGLARAGLTPQS